MIYELYVVRFSTVKISMCVSNGCTSVALWLHSSQGPFRLSRFSLSKISSDDLVLQWKWKVETVSEEKWHSDFEFRAPKRESGSLMCI